jgi:signal transduction histidine kinase
LRYDEKIEQNLFWIVDQACENAAKHSGGTQVLIKGSLTSQRIHLAVEDDGIGFSQNGELSIPAMLSARRFGLVGMYERADLIGAQLQITSSPGSGTTVSIKLEGNGLIQSSGEAL